MIPLILVISGMLVYEMNPYQGPGEGLVRIPDVTAHTAYFVFNPNDFNPYGTFTFLADATIADLVTLPDGTQRARIDLKDKELEIGELSSGAKPEMRAKWKGKPGAPIYDVSAQDTLDWVPSFSEMSGASQTLKGNADFNSIVSIRLGELTSARHPRVQGKIFSFQFLNDTGKPCSVSTIADHGLARNLVLKADGTDLVITLKDRNGKPLAAGEVKEVKDLSGRSVEMSITNYPSKRTPLPGGVRQDHLEMLFKAALKNPPTADKICLPSPAPPDTVTGSSAFCPPMQP